MSNLTPVKRMNKLGHVVTKHVRAGGQQPAAGSIPPPSGQSSMQRRGAKQAGQVYKPTGAQKQPIKGRFFVNEYAPDPRLMEALPKSSTSAAYWETNDVDAYGLLSSVDVPTAVALGCRGITTKDEALEFLSQMGLDDLITEDNDTADQAFRRKIKFNEYCEGVRSFGDKASDTGVLLDVITAHNSGTLKKINFKDAKPLEDRILDGEISMAEIEAVGVSRLMHSNMPVRVLDTLGKVHRGEVDFSAEDVKSIISKYYDEQILADSGITALNIAERFGASFVLNMHSVRNTALTYQWMHQTGKGPKDSYVKDILDYSDAMDRARVRPRLPSIVAMYRSGMPAGKAAELLAQGRTPEEVIMIRKEGINSNVAEGWL